jgi:Leucine-rich repeat (LRR) protein
MVALNLGGNSFSGTLPSAIGLFRELDALFLHFNNFGGTIPSSFVALTKLKALYLNSNQLRGTLPGQLVGALTRLTTLLLNNNAFNGTLPLEIRLLVSLRELDISFNRFYGTISQIPATVQMCTAQLNGDTNCFVRI